jgi:hypothetical protein
VSCVRGVGPALADEAFDVVTEPGQVDVADVEPLAVGLVHLGYLPPNPAMYARLPRTP